jgi:hypothetical protein
MEARGRGNPIARASEMGESPHGAGTVTLQASQTASEAYPAAIVTTSFIVSGATPPLPFTSTPNQTYGVRTLYDLGNFELYRCDYLFGHQRPGGHLGQHCHSNWSRNRHPPGQPSGLPEATTPQRPPSASM